MSSFPLFFLKLSHYNKKRIKLMQKELSVLIQYIMAIYKLVTNLFWNLSGMRAVFIVVFTPGKECENSVGFSRQKKNNMKTIAAISLSSLSLYLFFLSLSLFLFTFSPVTTQQFSCVKLLFVYFIFPCRQLQITYSLVPYTTHGGTMEEL